MKTDITVKETYIINLDNIDIDISVNDKNLQITLNQKRLSKESLF
ncbi:hypothetical protein [Clostridium gasigenes]|nr:hypothetical protein [Clostridium gasigenes]